MIVPNSYELNYNVNRYKLEKTGFIKNHGLYNKRYWLKKPFIYVSLDIDLEENSLLLQVKNTNNDLYYTPFYCENERYNNLVYPKVVKKYNKIMDGLCKRGILYKSIKEIAYG